MPRVNWRSGPAPMRLPAAIRGRWNAVSAMRDSQRMPTLLSIICWATSTSAWGMAAAIFARGLSSVAVRKSMLRARLCRAS